MQGEIYPGFTHYTISESKRSLNRRLELFCQVTGLDKEWGVLSLHPYGKQTVALSTIGNRVAVEEPEYLVVILSHIIGKQFLLGSVESGMAYAQLNIEKSRLTGTAIYDFQIELSSKHFSRGLKCNGCNGKVVKSKQAGDFFCFRCGTVYDTSRPREGDEADIRALLGIELSSDYFQHIKEISPTPPKRRGRPTRKTEEQPVVGTAVKPTTGDFRAWTIWSHGNRTNVMGVAPRFEDELGSYWWYECFDCGYTSDKLRNIDMSVVPGCQHCAKHNLKWKTQPMTIEWNEKPVVPPKTGEPQVWFYYYCLRCHAEQQFSQKHNNICPDCGGEMVAHDVPQS